MAAGSPPFGSFLAETLFSGDASTVLGAGVAAGSPPFGLFLAETLFSGDASTVLRAGVAAGRGVDVDVIQLYVDALAAFGNAVQDIADHEWDLPTPATEWNIKEVVAHVVLGEAHLSSVLHGDTSTTQGEFSVDLLGSSPMAAWRGTALRAIEAARAAGIAEQSFELDRGTVSGVQLLGYRITDNVVHAWDLRVAAGRPVEIEDRFAEWLLDFWQPMAGQIADSEFFAAPTMPASDSASDCLLALLGRTPPPDR